MITVSQPLLKLQRAYRPVLVDVNGAMQTLGYDSETIVSMAECGELRWVFDVSVHQARIRELRFWLGELVNRNQRELEQAEVIETIIGRRTEARLKAVTVASVLLVRRPTVHDYVRAGALTGEKVGNVQWIDRASLVAFLNRRVIA